MYKQIIKCTQHDLMQTNAKTGQMYYVVDIRALYKDNGPNIEQRMRFNATVLHTEYERINSIKPVIGRFYYVEETNSLWLYDTRWTLKIGNTNQYNTYDYSNGSLTPVINTDTSITNSIGDKIIDNNGLLGNGSVVVRDSNRILKGLLSINNYTNELNIKSYVDNGFIFIPNAHLPYNDLSTSLGALKLTVEKSLTPNSQSLNLNGAAYYYGDWNNYGSMYTVEENKNEIIYPDYIPINDLEVVKYYITCEKANETDNGTHLIKTYISIRPISSSIAIIHLISASDETQTSVVKNDMGELIFTGYSVIEQNVTFECDRQILSDSDYTSSVRYHVENLNLDITITQNKNSQETNVTISEDYCDDSLNTQYSVSKWTKNKVLTKNEIIDLIKEVIENQ